MAQTITNQSQVSFSYAGTTDIKTNTSNIVTTTMNDRLSIEVDKTSTTECFRPGEIIIYFVHIKNTGCQCLGRFLVSDNLCDNDVTYVEGSARLYIGGSMHMVTPTSISPLEFELTEQLSREEEMFLQYTVTVASNSEAEQITNHVCVEAYPCSCRCGENSSECIKESACLTLDRCQYAEVLITKSNTRDNICCGDELDYFITLTNTGNIDATNVVVTDAMPATFTATEVHMENNGEHYQFLPGEYSIDANNLLTVPVLGGRAILVPSLKPGYDNTTRLRIHGHV